MNSHKNMSSFALSFASLALVSGVSFNASAAGLPSGYQQIPYIQANNSGNNTYVLTDYTPNPQTDKIVAEVSFPEAPTENLCVWCARSGTSSPVKTFSTFVLKDGSDGNKLKFASHYGQQNNDEAFLSVVSKDTVYTVITEANTCKLLVAGEDISSCTHPVETDFTAAGGPMMLFASYNGNTNSRGNYGSFRLHSLKVYRSGTLFYDIVPVRDNSKALKLFNKTDNPINLPLSGTFTGDPWKSFLERLLASPNVVESSEAASGGNIIWRIGNDYMHIFTDATEAQAFTPAVNLNARILMVAGGGSGGGSRGGGGGAGGMIDTNDVALTASTSYIVTVGKGGDSVSDGNFGINGGDSKLTAHEASVVDAAIGGGGGGYGIANGDGKVGGSGGGGGSYTGNLGYKAPAGGSGTSGQGCDGGTGGGGYSRACAGGGGGAKSAGGAGGATSATAEVGLGVGGEGKISNILGYDEIFAGGGGGGMPEAFTSSKNGGLGGGGAGGITSSNKTAQDGENGLGGGGGGGTSGWKSGTINTTSGGGGSGIVIIRYHYTAQGEKDKINVPQVKTGLVYDGTEQQGVADGYGYTLSGHLATAGGTHTATATLTDPANSEWADDGSTAPKSIEWSIAQAVNVWTVEAKLSKTSWMVEEDTPADLTVPVAKFGDIVATLNDAEWDGATLPTEVGNYTSVWSVVETTDFTGLSVTKTFEILPVPPPEDRNARYFDGTEWKGANSFAEALAAVPDGGIVELNRDESSATTITISKSVTIRSNSAHDVRRKLQVTAATSIFDFNGAGCSFVISNLEVSVNHNAFNATLVKLTDGTLTLGDNLYMTKGSYTMGSILTAENAGTLNFDGVTMANSTAQWGLVRVGGTTTVNLRNCNIYGISVSTSAASNGSVLNLSSDKNVLNVYGGSITNNAVTSAAGYGQVYCAGTVNFFGGRPIIQDLGVKDANVIKLQGTFDEGASVGVVYGAAKGDQFGTYVSGDAASAQAFYLPKSADPELRGRKKVDKLVWKAFVQRGVVLIIR